MQQRIIVRHEWAAGSRIKADPEATARQFDQLRKRDGALKLESVIEASRAEDAPLHNEFEWDDAIAAEIQRKQHAAHIVGCFRRIPVNTYTEDEEPAERVYIPHRMVVATPAEPQKPAAESRVYVPIPVARTDEEKHAQVMTHALDRVDRLVREFKSIPVLADLAGELSDLLMKYR